MDRISELITHVKSHHWHDVYKEKPYRYTNMQNAMTYYRSKTYKKGFIIAHECHEGYIDDTDGSTKVREREFYAFHDVYHYIYHMREFSHAHEVICGYNGDTEESSGRIVFDFDIKKDDDEELDGRFKVDVNEMVKTVLTEFYKVIDISTVSSTWMTCDNLSKHSLHVTYQGAYFLFRWTQQLKVFYQLCELIILRDKLFPYMSNKVRSGMIDKGIARNHATLRMPFSSKLGGNPLLIDDWNGIDSFLSALIQDHDMDIHSDRFTKQLVELDTKYISYIYYPDHGDTKAVTKVSNKLPISDEAVSDIKYRVKKNKMNVLTSPMRECLKSILIELGMYDKGDYYHKGKGSTSSSKAERIIKKYLSKDVELMSMFTITGHSNGYINLSRVSESKCLISGKIHAKRPGFITYSNSINLHCRNPNCKTKLGKKYVVLYM